LKSELKKRINTGLLLILILIFMFMSKIVYLFISVVFFALSFVEFTKLSKLLFEKKYFKQFLSNFFFAIYLFIFLIIFIFGLNDIHFKIILFVILLICISSDIGGILFGKTFKGPKLTSISPNKTFSGSLGSFTLSMVMSIFLLDYIFNTELISNILLGFFVSLSVQLGDLFFSYLKRKSNLKNTGNILPGHGGILDRIDGILLGIPVGLMYVLVLVFTK
tara:strand:+ start:1686 stop:2345 length:660 start_codon:yes stop_codon:yes gene_type:complete